MITFLIILVSLDDFTLTAEKEYSINFIEQQKKTLFKFAL